VSAHTPRKRLPSTDAPASCTIKWLGLASSAWLAELCFGFARPVTGVAWGEDHSNFVPNRAEGASIFVQVPENCCEDAVVFTTGGPCRSCSAGGQVRERLETRHGKDSQPRALGGRIRLRGRRQREEERLPGSIEGTRQHASARERRQTALRSRISWTRPTRQRSPLRGRPLSVRCFAALTRLAADIQSLWHSEQIAGKQCPRRRQGRKSLQSKDGCRSERVAQGSSK
jgi:hypothetical protein